MWKIRQFCSSHFKNVLILFILSAFFVSPAPAQKSLHLSLDVAQFQDSRQQSYLEIYYSLPEQSIKYVPNAAGEYSSQMVMDLEIYKRESLWASKMWKIEKAIQDTKKVGRNRQLIDMFRYYLDEPSTYRVVIHARDMNQEDAIDSIDTKIETREFNANKLEISDVHLASDIKRTGNPSSKFAMRNYEIIPNPTLVFGEGVPNLYYCFEAYNLLNNVAGPKYKRFAFLRDSDSKVVEGVGSRYRTRGKLHDSSIEMGLINVSKLRTGQYFFDYGISDATGVELASKEKKLYVYNPSVPITPVAGAARGVAAPAGSLGELGTLGSEQLDKEYESMKYLTTKEDREFYGNLSNVEAKRQFIYSAWQSIKNYEGLKGADYRRLYLSRVEEANERYRETGREGWKTERGRVFILYGQPTNIELFPSSPEHKPYQIWTYDYLQGQGGITFIFADRFGFKRYELIHSTLRGELQDPNWQRFIVIGPFQQNIQRPNIQN
ncbi:MAG: GWxTD domain-containing protein [bacterium]